MPEIIMVTIMPAEKIDDAVTLRRAIEVRASNAGRMSAGILVRILFFALAGFARHGLQSQTLDAVFGGDVRFAQRLPVEG
jgi:hypothetical protein